MHRPKVVDLEAMLGGLSAAGIECVVVGGAAAVIHGAPTTTLDIDIVPLQTAENLDKLHSFLGSVSALVKPVFADRRLAPTRNLLEGTGHVQLATSLGPIDILCRLHDGQGYQELVARSRQIVDGNITIRILNLDALIEIKRAAGRPKDLLVVRILEGLLAT